jgi:uncharacterized membrane protein
MSQKNRKNANAKNTADRRAAKKAAVLGPGKTIKSPLIYVVVLAAVLIAGGIFFAIYEKKQIQFESKTAAPTASETQVTFPVSQFTDGMARHFQYSFDDGITVKYFVLKSSDGVIRAAFDACDVCWPAGKGYYQDGDVMVCRNCSRKFASVLVNEVKGGCNPAPLNRRVEGDTVVIDMADIMDGKQYFDFSKRS